MRSVASLRQRYHNDLMPRLIPHLFAGIKPLPYEAGMHEVALGIVFRPSDRSILMLERSDIGDGVRWVFPGGKYDPGRDGCLRRTAAREVLEETGVNVWAGSGKRIASRRHPVTHASVHYVFFEYRRGGCLNRESDKHLSVAWWPSIKVIEELGDRLEGRVASQLRLLAQVCRLSGRATHNRTGSTDSNSMLLRLLQR